jgi:hypothetical protein
VFRALWPRASSARGSSIFAEDGFVRVPNASFPELRRPTKDNPDFQKDTPRKDTFVLAQRMTGRGGPMGEGWGGVHACGPWVTPRHPSHPFNRPNHPKPPRPVPAALTQAAARRARVGRRNRQPVRRRERPGKGLAALPGAGERHEGAEVPDERVGGHVDLHLPRLPAHGREAKG